MVAAIHWNPRPDAFTVPFLGWPILWYGVLFALGFALSFPLMVSIFQRFFRAYHGNRDPLKHWKKLAVSTTDRLTLYVVIATVVGARLGHFLFYESPSRYLNNPLELFLIREGGLASHGAVIALLLALILFVKRSKIPGLGALKVLDLLIIPAGLVGACIRLGNFVNQEVLGLPSSLPWAVLFGHPADWHLAPVPRHPVQLYEALAYLAVFFLLWRLSYQKTFLLARGKLVGLGFILIFGFRFLIEFWKVEQSRFFSSGWLTMGQILSIPLVVLGVIFYFWEKRK